MDTPSVPLPESDAEKAILRRLIVLRDALLLLKRDRTKYVRSAEVMDLYDQTLAILADLGDGYATTDKAAPETQLDRLIESCLQLISLFFMTVGHNNKAPAAYALTSTIRRLLDHLGEAGLFSAKDLDSMSQTVGRLTSIVDSHEPAPNERYLVSLLRSRLDNCATRLKALQAKLDRLGPGLHPIYEKVISILRSISLANTRTKFSVSEVKRLQDQLKDIEKQLVDGKFVDADNNEIVGSAEVSKLLGLVLEWSEIVLQRKGDIPEAFHPQYHTLCEIRNKLETLTVTQAWSLRETDLYDYQRQLDRIDEARVNGNWIDEKGQPVELYVQRTFLYLIRRSYGYIYGLMISSEAVSEALTPIFNQLQTLKRCLIEVKASGGLSSPRELFPYSMKLNSIDDMRVDGKFMVAGDIPEGQATVNELLAECFDLVYDLKVDIEAEDEADGTPDPQ